jgi:hypothetical protein
MHIAIHSASASVVRVLETIITTSGHHTTTQAQADLVIVDAQHPSPLPLPEGPRLNLTAPTDTTASDATSIACPVRHDRLLQRLLMLSSTQRLALEGGWTLDMLGRALEHDSGTTLGLTEKECVLLKHLLQAHPAHVTRDTLLAQVWGMATAIDTHTLETHIYRLRSKLDTLDLRPFDIRTHDGAYMLALHTDSR